MKSARTRQNHRRSRLVATVVCIAGAAGASSAASGQPPTAPDATAYTTNGPVFAIARAGGRTYIGGDFTRVGVRSGPGAILAGADGSRQTFPQVAGGDVRATVSDDQGGWFIGGSFTSVGGAQHLGIAHIRSDGSVDPNFNTAATDLSGAPAAVDSLVYSDPSSSWPDHGTLYVGGEFSKIGIGAGQLHGNLAALTGGDGTPISAWGPATGCASGSGCDPAVRALALAHVPLAVGTGTQQVPVLLAGGGFATLGPSDNPQPVNALGAIWGVGAVDSTGSSIAGTLITTDPSSFPQPWGLGFSPSPAVVHALAVSGDATDNLAVYVGGTQNAPATPVLEAHRLDIAKATNRWVNDTGTQFSSWTPKPQCGGAGCTGSVNAMSVSGSTLYFAGDFATITVTPPGTQIDAKRVAKIGTVSDPTKSSSGPATPAAPVGPAGGTPADGVVRSIALAGTTLYMAGDFTHVSDQPRAYLGALDTGTGTATGWDPEPDTSGEAVAASGSTSSVYAGGEFSSLGSVTRAGLAAFDEAGALTSWSPGVAATSGSPLVRALAATGSTIYVGGRFDTVEDTQGNPHPHANLAAIDVGGTPIDGFNPAPSGTGAAVLSLSLLGQTLYTGGKFTQVGGQARTNLAALDAASGAATGWDPKPDDNVYALVPACGAIYIGGAFANAGGAPRDHIAALDPVSGSALQWAPDGADGTVLALTANGPTIYVGGNFAHIGGQLRQKVGALGAGDGTVAAFDPGASGPVRALTATSGAVYAGGTFDAIGGAGRSNLAALDPASGDATAWDPGPSGTVRALAVAGDNVYAGGEFTSVGPFQQAGFAPFTAGPGQTAAPAPCTPPPPVVISPAPKPVAPKPARIRVGRLTISPKRLRLGSRTRLRARFKLSAAAPVRLRFERRVVGRCPRRHRHGHKRRCVRFVRVVDVTGRGRKGANSYAFARQRVSRHRLARGTYRVTLTLVPPSLGGPTRRAGFTVVGK